MHWPLTPDRPLFTHCIQKFSKYTLLIYIHSEIDILYEQRLVSPITTLTNWRQKISLV